MLYNTGKVPFISLFFYFWFFFSFLFLLIGDIYLNLFIHYTLTPSPSFTHTSQVHTGICAAVKCTHPRTRTHTHTQRRVEVMSLSCGMILLKAGFRQRRRHYSMFFVLLENFIYSQQKIPQPSFCVQRNNYSIKTTKIPKQYSIKRTEKKYTSVSSNALNLFFG